MRDQVRQFLADFFEADGNHPHGPEARAHFLSTFVKPPNFNSLVEDLKPIANLKKVVVVDGHPRSGKTWCVVKALEKILGDENLGPSQWWTSGLDSLGVLPEDESDLYSAACKIQDKLTEDLRYVFLDDFLGTNQLRPLGKRIDDQRVRPFFLWTEDNPWLAKLSSGSVLVITARSLHLALTDILLDTDIRRGAPASTRIFVKNSRHGLFRTIDNGEPFGAFNLKTLKEACERNKENHPLMKHGDMDWVLEAVPLLAFESYETSLERHIESDDPQAQASLTPQQMKIASRALFGDDVDSLADIINTVETIQPDESLDPVWRARVLAQLYETYLVVIAPGLLFLGYSAYESLGIEETMSEIAVERLYLTRNEQEFYSGRLPNEFYMMAIEEHFKRHLDLAAHAFAKVLGQQIRESSDETRNRKATFLSSDLTQQQKSLGVGLRGLIERALYSRDTRSLEKLFQTPDFKDASEAYLKSSDDCLLHLELSLAGVTRYCTTDVCAVEITPGLAAAVGWVLYKFFPPSDREVREVVQGWFPNRFRSLLGTAATIPNSKSTHQSVDEWQKVATYSTFLQWVIKMEPKPEEGGLLSALIRLATEGPDEVRSKLEIVLFDELLWAVTEEGQDLDALTPIAGITDLLDSDPFRFEKPHEQHHHLIINVLFSLAWHNRWMIERAETNLGRRADIWIEEVKVLALKWLGDRPELLDATLQYHWSHFITQRAVWMRDWCFESDPNRFELDYSRIARGSENPDHNRLVLAMAQAALEQGEVLNPLRVRNLLLLLGTRAKRTIRFEDFLNRIDILIESEEERYDLSRAVLQAVFELGRQGFLDTWCESTTDPFRKWCKAKRDKLHNHIQGAWQEYREELDYHTHLDLLPRAEQGWRDVFPRHWKP